MSISVAFGIRQADESHVRGVADVLHRLMDAAPRADVDFAGSCLAGCCREAVEHLLRYCTADAPPDDLAGGLKDFADGPHSHGSGQLLKIERQPGLWCVVLYVPTIGVGHASTIDEAYRLASLRSQGLIDDAPPAGAIRKVVDNG